MSEQSTQRPQRPARITALLSLVDRLLADPLTAHLVTERTGIWQAGLNDISLIQHADPKTASDVLRVVGDLIGAEFVAGPPAGYDENITYEAEGTWAGVPVKLHLFAPGQTDRLRARVAELEAELATERARWEDAAASTVESRPLVISDEAIEAQYGADEASR